MTALLRSRYGEIYQCKTDRDVYDQVRRGMRRHDDGFMTGSYTQHDAAAAAARARTRPRSSSGEWQARTPRQRAGERCIPTHAPPDAPLRLRLHPAHTRSYVIAPRALPHRRAPCGQYYGQVMYLDEASVAAAVAGANHTRWASSVILVEPHHKAYLAHAASRCASPAVPWRAGRAAGSCCRGCFGCAWMHASCSKTAAG